MRLIIFFVLLFALCNSVHALSMNVEGNYVNEKVKVMLDEEAFIIFRMNYGTPIFAEGSTACFIPRVTGELYIEAIAGNERINKTISITKRQGGGSSGTDYTLPDGTFTVIADGKEFQVNWRTALGALEKASQILGFSYTVEEKSWGLYVKCIKGKCEKSDGETSGWMYWVNYPSDEMPGVSADEYEIEEGDKVIWYFSRSMDDTPDSSPYKIKITVSTGFAVGVESSWNSKRSSTTSSYTSTSPTYEKFSKSVLLSPGTERRIEISKGIAEKIDVISITLKSSKSKKILLEVYEDLPVSIPGKIYRCFSIDLSDSEIEGVIEFRVSKKWLNSLSPNQVLLIKYTDSGYIELPTELVEEDGEYYYYKSELKSFSTFAIIVKWRGFPLNTTDGRILRALEWLRTIQNDDGGFSNPDEESDIAKTSWAVMALAAAGENPNDWTKNNTSPIDYIRNNLKESIGRMGTADYARTILALKAVNENPRNFSGINLVDMLKSRIKENGQIGDFIYTTIWGIMALKACDEDVNKSVEWLKQQQNEDGGFAWTVGEKSDYDDTAAAIQALIAAGEPGDSEVIKKALDYLKTGQNEDGGFRYFGSSASNAASDSWVIQALVAAGENPTEWKKNNVSVVEHLLSLQTEEGFFNYTSYQTSNPGYMTVCAIMALLGKPHPVKAEEFLNLSFEDSIRSTENGITRLISSTPESPEQNLSLVTPTTQEKLIHETLELHSKPETFISMSKILAVSLLLATTILVTYLWRRRK